MHQFVIANITQYVYFTSFIFTKLIHKIPFEWFTF